MPTYDYRCDSCGHTFEAFQKMSDEVLIGAGSGIIFKGSGFYETDYKRSRKDGGKKDEKKPEPKKSESKSDD